MDTIWWVLLAIILGAITATLSWRLKVKTAANMALLEEMKARRATEESHSESGELDVIDPY